MNSNIKQGDIVGRISHGNDILFKVTEIVDNPDEKKAILRGLDVRLFADAPLRDLERKSPSEISRLRQEIIKKNSEKMRNIFERRVKEKSKIYLRKDVAQDDENEKELEHFEIPGVVLHLDGDQEYLELCKTTYAQLNIKAYTFHVNEEKQAKEVIGFLKTYKPDILILTGHDGFIKNRDGDFRKVENYRNSSFFIEAVRKAREYEPGRDDLIIFAGACQSHYEALIAAGANFASSPQRVLIHAFDPVFVVEKLAYTSIYETLNVEDVIRNTITGLDGVGGIETRGCLRLGFPKSPY